MEEELRKKVDKIIREIDPEDYYKWLQEQVDKQIDKSIEELWNER